MATFTRTVGYYAAACFGGAMLTSSVAALEPGDFGQYFRGVTIGDPVAVAPPAGLYFENVTLYAPHVSGHGQVAAVNASATAEIPVLIWSTGWKFLDAAVVMFITKPYFEVTAWSSAAAGPPFASTHFPAWHNTGLNPLTLSWNFNNGWFASAGLTLRIPNGSRYNNTPTPDCWTFEPTAAITYFADGWDLTAHLVYDINRASAGYTGAFAGTPAVAFGIGYRSGDQAILDLTATKTFGKWEIGPVGYIHWQPTSDHPGSGYLPRSIQTALQQDPRDRREQFRKSL